MESHRVPFVCHLDFTDRNPTCFFDLSKKIEWASGQSFMRVYFVSQISFNHNTRIQLCSLQPFLLAIKKEKKR